MRELTRLGPVFIADKLGLQASTVGRVVRRHRVPLLRELDPITGVKIRAERRSANRYEHAYPGSLIHVDVENSAASPTAADGGCTVVVSARTVIEARATTTSTP